MKFKSCLELKCEFLLSCENSLIAECGLGRVGIAESDLVTRGCYMASLADSTVYARGILHFALAGSLSSKLNCSADRVRLTMATENSLHP